MRQRLLIRGGRVLDGDGDQGIRDVSVAGGTITGVDASGASDATDRVLDAGGLVVMPGVVDSHVHLTDLGATRPSPRSPAHERLARAGVTTAVEFFDFATVLDQWHASAVGLTVLGLQGLPAYGPGTPAARIRDDAATAVANGSIGVKILGGHFPSTPEAAARAIEEAAGLGCYVGFHAGTTANGSNLDGMREAVQAADGRPLHLAHTNAYLRGAVDEVAAENAAAIELLRANRNVVSESHLAGLNLCLGGVEDGAFTDHIVVNCLRMGGYPTTVDGLRNAFTDGFAHCLVDTGDQAVPVTGAEGADRWAADPSRSSLCFPVNRRLSAYLQSCARTDGAGELRYEGPGQFVIDAIASDGGYWRNVILDQGLALVQFGALSLVQLAHKTSRAPAALFGLHDKGRIAPGYDADLIGVDLDRRQVRFTVAGGQLVFDGRDVVGTGGVVATTRDGVAALRHRGIPHHVVDLATGEPARRQPVQ